MISDILQDKLNSIDAAIIRAEARASDEIAALNRQKAALLAAQKFLTPEAEQTIKALQAIGLLQDLK